MLAPVSDSAETEFNATNRGPRQVRGPEDELLRSFRLKRRTFARALVTHTLEVPRPQRAVINHNCTGEMRC